MKNSISISLFCLSVALLLNLVVSSKDYKLIKIQTDKGKCLDGSAPAIYYRKSSNPNWIIYFESGGWCGTPDFAGTLADCYSRSQTPLGSSSSYSDSENFEGIMSSKYEISRYYHDYNGVWIKYCDGTGH